MIRVFDSDRYLRARVWLDELPELGYQSSGVIGHTAETNQAPSAQTRQAAVELFIPAGGRALYGLLGAELIPTLDNKLLIQVAVSADPQRRFEWSLAGRVDEVSIGLPADYAEGVITGALQRSDILGAGVLRFDRAAHGVVGSSWEFFRRLATIVVHVLVLQPVEATDEEMNALFLRRWPVPPPSL